MNSTQTKKANFMRKIASSRADSADASVIRPWFRLQEALQDDVLISSAVLQTHAQR